MKHEAIEPAGPGFGAIRQSLAAIAAGIDSRFVDAGSTLAIAIDTIERVIASLDGIINAFDARSAGAAVRALRESARRLDALPALQDERVSDIGIVRRAATDLHAHVMQIHEALSILRVNGSNLRITAAGSIEIEKFVDEMIRRFDAGDEHLEDFMDRLRELVNGIGGVQRAARLLASECGKLIPQVPDRLADDALELQAYQAVIADSAARVGEAARGVRGRTGVVLGALQIGDITRQRIEHIVAAMQLLGAFETAHPDEAARPAIGHVLRLIAAQLTSVASDFEHEAGLLLGSLGELGPDTERLLGLLEECGADGESRSYLHRLERGITEIDELTVQLRTANERAHLLSATIADTMDALVRRLDGVRSVRSGVQNIVTAVQLHGHMLGTAGRPAAEVAGEVGDCAERLNQAVNGVAWAIRELNSVSMSIRHRHDYETELDAGLQLGRSLASIREACRRTEQGIGEGGVDARDLIEMLAEAGERLGRELALSDTIQRFADQLRTLAAPDAPLTPEIDEALRTLLVRIGSQYSMARERAVHCDFLLPGMEWVEIPRWTGELESFEELLF